MSNISGRDIPAGESAHDPGNADEAFMVGEYLADYSEITAEELGTPTPEMDDLIRRSQVISTKRL